MDRVIIEDQISGISEGQIDWLLREEERLTKKKRTGLIRHILTVVGSALLGVILLSVLLFITGRKEPIPFSEYVAKVEQQHLDESTVFSVVTIPTSIDGSAIVKYHRKDIIDPVLTEALEQYVGDLLKKDGEDQWYQVKGTFGLQYLIKKDKSGKLTLWESVRW